MLLLLKMYIWKAFNRPTLFLLMIGSKNLKFVHGCIVGLSNLRFLRLFNHGEKMKYQPFGSNYTDSILMKTTHFCRYPFLSLQCVNWVIPIYNNLNQERSLLWKYLKTRYDKKKYLMILSCFEKNMILKQDNLGWNVHLVLILKQENSSR